MSINYKKIDHFTVALIHRDVCLSVYYIYIDLLKLDSRTKLQPQRRIPEAPTRHINKFQRMILAQKLLIT